MVRRSHGCSDGSPCGGECRDGVLVLSPRPARFDAVANGARGEALSYMDQFAAGMIARSLGAFFTEAESERERTTDRTRPWKIDATHLMEALAALKEDSGKNAYVSQVVDRGTRLLTGTDVVVNVGTHPAIPDIPGIVSPARRAILSSLDSCFETVILNLQPRRSSAIHRHQDRSVRSSWHWRERRS